MNGIRSDELITVAQLAEELDIPRSRAALFVSEAPVVMTVGRTKLYYVKDVQDFLSGYYDSVMQFLGVRPRWESYDGNITAAEDSV